MMPVRSDDMSRCDSCRVFQLGDEHRRHAVDGRAALGLDRLERGRGCSKLSCGKTTRRRSRRRTSCPTRSRSNDTAAPGADAVAVVEPLMLGRVERVQQQIAVTQQCALGRPGRSGSVLQVDRIVRREFAARLPPAVRSRTSSAAASRSCHASIPGCSEPRMPMIHFKCGNFALREFARGQGCRPTPGRPLRACGNTETSGNARSAPGRGPRTGPGRIPAPRPGRPG